MEKNETQIEKPRRQAAPAADYGRANYATFAPGSEYGYGYYQKNAQQYHYHPYKKIYRSKDNKWLGGVCAGLAKYFNTDPLLMRLLWVILTLASIGVGIIGYILFWLFIDTEPAQYALSKQYVTTDEYGREHRHYHYQVS